MTHYLAESEPVTGEMPTVEEWEARVDGYDVEAVADQIEATGADWMIFSVGQISGFWAAPNARYDELVPATAEHPSRLATRDLVADLGEALHDRGLRLIVYFVTDPPRNDPYADAQLSGGTPSGANGNDTFRDNWRTVFAEYAAQWGTSVDGWWIDGAWQPNEEDYYTSFVTTAQRHNADTVVTLNPGLGTLCSAVGTDYTAGEARPTDLPVFHDGRYVNCPGVAQTQVHYLSYAQGTWGSKPDAPMALTTAQFVNTTRAVTDYGGAVTWDVGFHREDGTLSDAAMAQFAALREGPRAGEQMDDADATDPRLRYSSGWSDDNPGECGAGDCLSAKHPRAKAQLTFTGTGFTWYGNTGPEFGPRAAVRVDGRLVDIVETWSDTPRTGVALSTVRGLRHGRHTVEIAALGNGYVTIDSVATYVARPSSGLTVVGTGLEVAVQSPTTGCGVPVVQVAPGTAANQTFHPLLTSEGHERLIAHHSGQSIVVQSASTQPGTPIIQCQYSLASPTNDEWLREDLGDGRFRLKNRHSGLYLTASSTEPGASMVQTTWSGSPLQIFTQS
ncbi:alpha-L-fucosidase [Jiangella alba]|nr:alpha-L-fucosidase [Jiangella alba]